jgi:hypothetical protein
MTPSTIDIFPGYLVGVTRSHNIRETVIIPPGVCVIFHALLAHAGSAYDLANCRFYAAFHTKHCIFITDGTDLI